MLIPGLVPVTIKHRSIAREVIPVVPIYMVGGCRCIWIQICELNVGFYIALCTHRSDIRKDIVHPLKLMSDGV